MKEQKKNKAFRFRWYRRVGVMMWMIFSYLSLFAYIPDEIYVAEEGDRTAFARGLPIDVVEPRNRYLAPSVSVRLRKMTGYFCADYLI